MNLAETILSSQLDNWIVLLFVAISWKHFFFQLIYRQPVYTGLKMALYVWIFCIFIFIFFFTWYPCGDETPSPTPYNARVFKKIREGKRNVVAAGYEIKGKKKLNLECFLILFLKEKIKDCGR